MKKRTQLAAFVFLMASTAWSISQVVGSLPFNLQNGTTADASQVMANFNTIVSNTNANAATIASLAAVSTVANAALPKAGGTMTGAITMGSNAITGLPAPSGANDAATKTYVDAAIASAISGVAAVPTGTVGAFNLGSCPTGWVAADGSGGTVDARGVAVRGLDNGRGLDPARTLASYQADQVQDHNHWVGYDLGASAMRTTKAGGGAEYQTTGGASVIGSQSSTGPMATGNAGTETRMKNVALLMCQKS